MFKVSYQLLMPSFLMTFLSIEDKSNIVCPHCVRILRSVVKLLRRERERKSLNGQKQKAESELKGTRKWSKLN